MNYNHPSRGEACTIAFKFHGWRRQQPPPIADAMSCACVSFIKRVKRIISCVRIRCERQSRSVAKNDDANERRGLQACADISEPTWFSKYLGYRFVGPVKTSRDLSLVSCWPACVRACVRCIVGMSFRNGGNQRREQGNAICFSMPTLIENAVNKIWKGKAREKWRLIYLFMRARSHRFSPGILTPFSTETWICSEKNPIFSIPRSRFYTYDSV